ncbi:MAG: hypothetical protein ACOZNI_10440 [Myxococcota bacterium]
MSKAQPFVVPEGVVFVVADDGVVIENRGDILLHTNFGRPLKSIVSHEGSVEIHADIHGGTISAAHNVALHGHAEAARIHAGGHVSVHGDAKASDIESGGAVELHGAATVDRVNAGGAVTIAGVVQAGTVRGDTIHLKGGTIAAKGLQGARAVHIGAAKLTVDAVIAPEVHVDAQTAGRVTVIECQNELGPNAIKGGFRLADYAEMFGDPKAFLTERGLNALGDAPPPAPAAPAQTHIPASPTLAPSHTQPPPPAKAKKEKPAPEPSSEGPLEIIEPSPVPSQAPPPSEEVQMEMDDEPVSEPAGTPVMANVPEHPLHKQLVDAVSKIAECYADAELPPAVSHLRGLIDTRNYDKVRGEITTIWSDLLKFHQKKGMRIQHQVTTTFNTINTLVKKM